MCFQAVMKKSVCSVMADQFLLSGQVLLLQENRDVIKGKRDYFAASSFVYQT